MSSGPPATSSRRATSSRSSASTPQPSPSAQAESVREQRARPTPASTAAATAAARPSARRPRSVSRASVSRASVSRASVSRASARTARGRATSRRAARTQANQASRTTRTSQTATRPDPNQAANQGGQNRFDDDEEGGGRRRRGRYRDRKRRGGRPGELGQGYEEPELTEDDVLLPVAGIVDVLDSYAFIRTSGYLPGPNDVYVSLGQVKKNGLRKGDAVTGAVRQPREGEQQGGQGNRSKFNALVRLDTVNGMTPDQAQDAGRVRQADPAVPAGAAAAGDRARAS